MKHNFLYITCFLTSLLALTACSQEENNDIPIDQKTPIQLSVGDISGMASRAITKDNDALKTALPTGTSIYMVMKSDYVGSGTSQTSKYTMTMGVTKAANENTKEAVIDFSASGCTRYWDDAFAREAAISVYGVCTPNGSPVTPTIGTSSTYTHTTSPTSGAWSTTANTLKIANWEVKTDQASLSAKVFANQDLCYSNNISKWSETDGEDKRLKFNTTSRRFDGGNMNFYHALSLVTINIKKGASFLEDTFEFTPETNIKLTGFNTKNTSFDIAKGTFDGTSSSSVITRMSQASTPTAGYNFTLNALTIPGTDMSTEVKGDIEFVINNSKYQIKKKDLLDAVVEADKNKFDGESKNLLKPGVHYIFNLEVSKVRVEKITASIVEWEIVNTTEQTVDNAKVTVTGLNDSGTHITDFSLYRTVDAGNTVISDSYEGYKWDSAYEGPATLTEDNTTTHNYVSNWYWDDNIKFYHFRSLKNVNLTTADAKNYVELTSKEEMSSSDTYSDAQWGAPFNALSSGNKFQYDTTNGFNAGNQIYKAIGATHDPINLTMFHLMSDITFIVKTTESANKVELKNTNGTTKIELHNVHKTGTASMGTGLVSTPATGATTFNFANPVVTETGEAENKTVSYITWHAGFVPQSLTNVELVITTPDGNEYIVDMAEVLTSSATPTYNNVTYPSFPSNKVNYWYPGIKYTYTFKLTKTGIEKITANLVNWEDVSAGDDNVQIR